MSFLLLPYIFGFKKNQKLLEEEYFLHVLDIISPGFRRRLYVNRPMDLSCCKEG